MNMTAISAKAIINCSLTQTEQQLISDTITRLGRAMMTESAHGYRAGSNETILAAAKRGVENYTKNSQSSSAIAIMDVILAANRDYNKQVAKNVERMRQLYPGLTIKQLAVMTKGAGTAKKFKDVWGHNDDKKFQTLKAVLAVFIPRLRNTDKPDEDFRVMSEWAANVQLPAMYQDPVGVLPNIGIATFQHLRMNFGANTVKPDRRVKEVLKREFNLRLSDEKSILVVERMAEIEKATPLLIDQIFVKYGSGHYRAHSDAVRSAVEGIVRNLKRMRMPAAQIAKVTGWSLNDIESVSHPAQELLATRKADL